MSTAEHNLRTVRVDLSDRGYDVVIGPGLLGTLAQRLADTLGVRTRGAFVVYDANVGSVATGCVGRLERAGIAVEARAIHASEPGKSLETLGLILADMGRARLERTDPVVALGGGITGDVGGFAAAVYRRGVPVVQCPTTLLSMVDASVGGKTGVNLEVGGALQKNMVGAFHQPVLVLADTETLVTLPDRELCAGLAECVKHALLGGCMGDTEHLSWIEANLADIRARRAGVLTELIGRSVAFKAAVVVGDEREMAAETSERPGRALLNLGHTFAHVMETLPGAAPAGGGSGGPLLHGEAVGLGLVSAAATGAALGLCDPTLGERIRSLLTRCGLPTRAAGLPDDADLLGLMGADKKTSGGRLRLVLPTPGCTARLVASPDPGAISAGWSAIRAQ